MTNEQRDFTIRVLTHDYRPFVLVALSLVNLGDAEKDVLIYRYMRRHTQDETAEFLKCSVNHVFDVQQSALKRCWNVWHKNAYVKAVMSAAP